MVVEEWPEKQSISMFCEVNMREMKLIRHVLEFAVEHSDALRNYVGDSSLLLQPRTPTVRFYSSLVVDYRKMTKDQRVKTGVSALLHHSLKLILPHLGSSCTLVVFDYGASSTLTVDPLLTPPRDVNRVLMQGAERLRTWWCLRSFEL